MTARLIPLVLSFFAVYELVVAGLVFVIERRWWFDGWFSWPWWAYLLTAVMFALLARSAWRKESR